MRPNTGTRATDEPVAGGDAVNRLLRGVLYGAMLALFALHNDPWLQADTGRLLGLPVGLVYHCAICVAATALLALMVRHAWPRHLDAGADSKDGAP